MSITEYAYEKVTHAKLLKCLKWCKGAYQLHSWEFDLVTGGEVPQEFADDASAPSSLGRALIKKRPKKAVVWVNIPLHISENENPYCTLVHEMLHIMYKNVRSEEERIETLESGQYRLFCVVNKIKEAKKK